MKQQNVKVTFKGLKCDHCDWKDTDIPFEEYHKYVNAKCPVCGGVILTEADYAACKALKSFEDIANLFSMSIFHGKRHGTYKVSMDGSGQIELHEVENGKDSMD